MIDSNITLKKLEVFLSFMTKGNINLVAEAMELSSVSVHRSLHSLEEGVKCPLFIHKGRTLQPLPTAFILEKYAKEILQLTEQAVNATCQAAGLGKTRIRIGTLYSLTIETIPQLIIGFKLRKPEIEIDLIMGSNQELLAQLEHDQLDAMLISISDSSLDKNLFEVLPLFEDDLFIAGPIDSPLLAKPDVSLQDLQEQNFIALSEGFATYHSLNKAFASTNFKPHISMYVNDIFSLINLVQAGVGFSLLPGRMKTAYLNTVKMVPFAKGQPISQTIGLVFARSRERDPNLLTLVAISRMYALAQQTHHCS